LFILVNDRGLSLNFNYIKSNLEMEKGKFNWAATYLNITDECKDKMQPRDYVVLSDKLHDVDKLVQEIKNR